MTTLVWARPGEKTFDYGVDRGVLYLSDGTGIVWNGLTTVESRAQSTSSPGLYFDGIKFHETAQPADFSGVLRAFTYPNEFLEYEGTNELVAGFGVTGQVPKKFGLSWRTKLGNDHAPNLGYKLHILCNVLASPSTRVHKTVAPASLPLEFEWLLTSVPDYIPGFRPTSYLILDSTRLDPEILEAIEDILYGTGLTPPSLPRFSELALMLPT